MNHFIFGFLFVKINFSVLYEAEVAEQLSFTYVVETYNFSSLTLVKICSIQHYMIMFGSDLLKVGIGVLFHVLLFIPPKHLY